MAKRAAPVEESTAYDRHRKAAATRSREISAKGRDIGEIPPIANKARRKKCSRSLRHFLETYLPERFPLKWSADHLKVIDRIEAAVLKGGLFALAMPRGSGKTTICEGAILWAALEGHHAYCVLIGASSDAASEMLESIKSELDGNDLLCEDYPEVCVPIRALDGNAQRCKGQTHNGQRTMIVWKRTFLVFPRIDGSKASEAVLKVAGITGRVRGMKHTRSDGTPVRPSFVLVDDPQTDDSAYSPQQCSRRLKTMNGAILKLAGPGHKISAVCPCTVIRRGDAADSLLDRDRNPHWQGERCKMLYAFPENLQLWKQYAILRAEALKAGGDDAPAKKFYADNRKAMDAGAIVAWPERLEPGDLSALESAMRLWIEDKYSFMAECQNEPIDEEANEGDLKPSDLLHRFSGRPRKTVPVWASKLTAFVDVQGSALFWLVAAWDPTCFTGAVVDYGVWPDQPGRRYYTLADLQHTIQSACAAAKIHAGIEGQIRYALDQCTSHLLGREWPREGAVGVKIDRLFVDAGFETETVYEFARSSPHAGVILPSHGRAIGAKSRPFAEYQAKPGERSGFHWYLTSGGGKRAIRHVLIDVHFWKSFLVQRLRQALGEPGAITFFGSSRTDADHDMLADHLCAEKSTRVEAKGRVVLEWDQRPGRPDNHWLDCLVGAAAAASYEGVTLAGQGAQKKPRVSWREQQRRKRDGQ